MEKKIRIGEKELSRAKAKLMLKRLTAMKAKKEKNREKNERGKSSKEKVMLWTN